jgi:hypothetical protein
MNLYSINRNLYSQNKNFLPVVVAVEKAGWFAILRNITVRCTFFFSIPLSGFSFWPLAFGNSQ